MMRMLRGAGASLVAALSFAAAAPAETWQPQTESPMWAATREQLTQSGDLPARPWLFMEGLHTPALRAAEYLADPTRTRLGVAFDGALLIQKKDADNWTVRLVRMRALCNQQRLQRWSAQGAWVDYVGRDGTAAKVQWICALRPPG